MAKVEEKKNNKAIIITLSICLSVVVIIVLLLTLIDPIVGASKMKKARDAAESCDEIVISAPLYKDSFIQGAEVIISDGEAKELANIFLSAAEKASYDESFEGLGGLEKDDKMLKLEKSDNTSLYGIIPVSSTLPRIIKLSSNSVKFILASDIKLSDLLFCIL